MSRLYCGCRLRDVFGRVVAHRVWVEIGGDRGAVGKELLGDFRWGMQGSSAPHEALALAILSDVIGTEEEALPHVPVFAAEFVSRWPERWQVAEERIVDWLCRRLRQAEADEVTQRLFVASGIREEEGNGEEGAGDRGGLGEAGGG